jgi:hypothetical protein
MENQKQITENNKLLAEFLGLTLEQEQERIFIQGLGTKLIEDTFNTDWNWLMEVVEKIENITIQKLSFNFNIQKDGVSLFYSHINEPKEQIEMYFEWRQKTKIANTYKIAIEFIKWYNEQK